MVESDSDKSSAAKENWEGRIVAVHHRIRLLRSLDQRNHNYLGYVLRVSGTLDGQPGQFTVGIGKAAQAKHAFRAGDVVSGQAQAVADPRMEPVQYYKASKLKLLERASTTSEPPPWHKPPPI